MNSSALTQEKEEGETLQRESRGWFHRSWRIALLVTTGILFVIAMLVDMKLVGLPSTSNNVKTKAAAPLTHPQWCPNAECHNTDLCHPCQRRFLIIISTARSASTTLTWMLDSLPGIRMAGENNDALGKLRQMHHSIVYNKMMQKFNHETPQKDRNAWTHNEFIPQSFACISQAMIRFLNPPSLDSNGRYTNPQQAAHEIIGFKTVRFFETIGDSLQEEQDAANWLKTHFPCSRILININSDVQQHSKSILSTFTNSHKTAIQVLEERRKEHAKLLRLAQHLGSDQAYLLDKALWTKGDGDMRYLNDALQWLGFHESCQFEELLQFNVHKYGNGQKTQLQQPWPNTCVAL